MSAFDRVVSLIKHRRAALYRWAHFILPLALLLGIVGTRIFADRLVELVQFRAFDELMVAQPRPYVDVDVRVIDIDDESLSRMGQWPWPRTLLARLVTRLGEAGAAAIALDIVFSERDRTSPPRGLGLPDHDDVFARAVARFPVVLGVPLSGQANSARPMEKAAIASRGEVGEHGIRANGAVLNIPPLERAARGLGAITSPFERDGVIRRVPVLWALQEQVVPSLAAEGLRVAQGATTYAVRGSQAVSGRHSRVGIEKIKVGQAVIPTDGAGRIWLYPTKQAPGRVIPAWKVMDKSFDPASMEGCLVFVGTSAEGLKDLRATALDPAAAGVEIHANIAEQILSGTAVQRPYWSYGYELLYMLLLGLLLIVLLPRIGAAWCLPVAAAGVGGAAWFSWHAFTAWRYLVDPVFPAATTLVIYMASSIVSYLKSEAERRQVKGAFSRYMSPALVEQLARHPEKLKLGGETREMTFHFCDIRGFTTISEQFDPHGLTQFINRFLTPMTEIILSTGGVIDKYMGDCIMAFWNAPLDDPEHARHGCAAALAMHAKLAQLNEQWRREAEAEGRAFVRVEIGTGLNTGRCVVGNMGSDQRFDYSVLGDDVNLASRLEGQSKNYGVPIVIGANTRGQAPEFAALELDLIKVKGKTVPVRVYALLGDALLAADAAFREHAALHDEMLAAYRSQRWDRARALLEKCRAAKPELEKLYDLYAGRLDAFAAAPPAPGWDGAFVAASK